MKKEDIEQRLLWLDQEATALVGEGCDIDCYIAGGAAFILADYSFRESVDIDVLKTTNQKIEQLFETYDVNTNVKAYSDYFPLGYEKRAQLIPLKTKTIYQISTRVPLPNRIPHRGKTSAACLVVG